MVFNESFIEDGFSKHAMMFSDCLHFSDKFANYIGVGTFAFSNSDKKISLETDWDKAVEMLDTIPKGSNDIQDVIEVTLSEIASWKKCDIKKIRITL